MKYIDCFCHILPPAYLKFIEKNFSSMPKMLERAAAMPMMSDPAYRKAVCEKVSGYCALPSTASPTFEALAGPLDSPEIARCSNDAFCELSENDRFMYPSFIASLPLNNPEEAAKEAERAVKKLGACAIQLFTNINGEPLDQDQNEIIFSTISKLDVPIVLHPVRPYSFSDYKNEDYSKYELWWAYGWPYETTVAMTRLALWGIFERYPNLKIITHHAGAYVPVCEGRIQHGLNAIGSRTAPALNDAAGIRLKGSLDEHMRKFYADTATFGSTHGIEAAVSYFGVEKTLFATDLPFGAKDGLQIMNTIAAVENSRLTDSEKELIFYRNCESIFKIPLTK